MILRYSNLLSEITELFATWTPSRQVPKFCGEKVSNVAWPLTRFKAVWYGHTNYYTPTVIYLLRVISEKSEKPSDDVKRVFMSFYHVAVFASNK